MIDPYTEWKLKRHAQIASQGWHLLPDHPGRLRPGVLGVYYRRTREGTRYAHLRSDYILEEIEP